MILLYRWAEPTAASWNNLRNASAGGGATLRLRDTPLAGYVGGARSWSIHAGVIDIARLPNTSLTSVQSATITDLKDGTLYEPPRRPAPAGGAATAQVMDPSAAGTEPIAATFHATQGVYNAGAIEGVPPDLQMLYTVQWQFKLSGDVEFRTRSKDELSAPSMTIYNLVSRRTGRPEQRIVCDQGARMTHLGIQVTANSMRFNPKDRTVECLTGVRGVYKDGTVQAERVYWSLNDEVLRCPDAATGHFKETPFIAQGVVVDVKRNVLSARHIHAEIDVSNGALNRRGAP